MRSNTTTTDICCGVFFKTLAVGTTAFGLSVLDHLVAATVSYMFPTASDTEKTFAKATFYGVAASGTYLFYRKVANRYDEISRMGYMPLPITNNDKKNQIEEFEIQEDQDKDKVTTNQHKV